LDWLVFDDQYVEGLHGRKGEREKNPYEDKDWKSAWPKHLRLGRFEMKGQHTNPKWSLGTSCPPNLSASGFSGFKDFQDFLHRLPSKIFLLFYPARWLAALDFIYPLYPSIYGHYFLLTAIRKSSR
jgi:hypothetical protein